jgi:ankyrin repeat protein
MLMAAGEWAFLVHGWVDVPTDNSLFIAVQSGDAARMRQLLDQGVPVTQRDRENCTALHWAAIVR